MNEFVEYLDVRQEEQNPFQTQSLLNAGNEIGNYRAELYLRSNKTRERCRRKRAKFFFLF